MDLTDEDVLDAMRSMQGYVDITPGTFREIYELAYDLALERVRALGRAGEIMSSPVHCLDKGMKAPEAAARMAALGVSGAPVLDGAGRVCGVVSEKDFLRRMGLPGTATFMTVVSTCLNTPGCMVADLRGLLVDDLMSSPPVVAAPETTVAEVSELFARHSINRLPICDGEGRPVGIVTRTDLVGAMCGR
jgi:CBS domain-containing protein